MVYDPSPSAAYTQKYHIMKVEYHGYNAQKVITDCFWRSSPSCKWCQILLPNFSSCQWIYTTSLMSVYKSVPQIFLHFLFGNLAVKFVWMKHHRERFFQTDLMMFWSKFCDDWTKFIREEVKSSFYWISLWPASCVADHTFIPWWTLSTICGIKRK